MNTGIDITDLVYINQPSLYCTLLRLCSSTVFVIIEYN